MPTAYVPAEYGLPFTAMIGVDGVNGADTEDAMASLPQAVDPQAQTASASPTVSHVFVRIYNLGLLPCVVLATI